MAVHGQLPYYLGYKLTRFLPILVSATVTGSRFPQAMRRQAAPPISSRVSS